MDYEEEKVRRDVGVLTKSLTRKIGKERRKQKGENGMEKKDMPWYVEVPT